ncbi:hypothetical protein [Desulforegula conservatrix]|uniref:hypothetical protein n=1 Tax=Desulforegula conservatrix TaxID=153026 RepID=UPI000407C393|nr:hypothetical protein [Desulforegula conservatrix]
MKKTDKSFAFALGGLAGNNAHGAGFLQAAMDLNLEPDLISCTSGQIYWVHKYLKERESRKDLRSILVADIDESTPFKNNSLDLMAMAIFGKGGVFKPAYFECLSDYTENLKKFFLKSMKTPSNINPLPEAMALIPAKELNPEFPVDFFKSIGSAFNNSETGIVFNTYEPVTGTETVYLNDAAAEKMRVRFGDKNKYRLRTRYEKISADAVKKGLWIYQYGFEADTREIDGAYYRQILLSELVHSDIIFVARPINHRWLGTLPTNKTALEDLKTEITFNGTYAGERDKIQLINKLVSDEALKESKYKHIELSEIEISTQEGFFDYIFEDLKMFDLSRLQSKTAIEKAIASK